MLLIVVTYVNWDATGMMGSIDMDIRRPAWRMILLGPFYWSVDQ